MIGIGMASYERWYNAEKDDSMIKQVLQSLWKGKEYLQVYRGWLLFVCCVVT